jgi:signal transduction histidine kinase/CheY-like chemotaxis protein
MAATPLPTFELLLRFLRVQMSKLHLIRQLELGALRTRLLALCLIIAIPFAVSIAYTAHRQRLADRAGVQEIALTQALFFAGGVRSAIADAKALLTSLTHNPDIIGLRAGECGELSSAVVRQGPAYTNVTGIDPDGRVFCRAAGSRAGPMISPVLRPWFELALKDHTFVVSDYMLGPNSGRPVILVAHSFSDATGRVQGVVQVTMDVSWYNGFPVNKSMPSGWALTIVDRGGLVLFRHPTSRQLLGRPLPESAVLERIRAQPQGSVELTDANGVPSVFAFTTVQDSAARVIVEAPLAAVLADANLRLATNLGLLGLALVVVLVGGVVLATRLIVRPVAELVTATRRITEGDLAVRTKDTFTGEFGALAGSFNRMAESLAQREAERQQHEKALRAEIAAREETQAELARARDAALEASKLKAEFLANMSHEIRTPLNGVIGMTELALDTDLTSRQREYLGMVKGSGDLVLEIVNDILDFSRMEAGRLTLDPTEFRLREMLDDTVRPLALRAQKKGLEFRWDVHDDVPDALVADASRLRQIVINLVGNAIKFTNAGEVVLSVWSEPPEASKPDDVVLHAAVRDTGIGIAPEQQSMIFDAFRQADGSITRTYGGTGLGLTISSSLARMLGGRIWVESKLGSGATFHFTVRAHVRPLGAPSEIAPGTRLAPASQPAPVRPDSLRLLLAEDNVVNQRVAIGLLEKAGHEVTLAQDGKEALAAFEGMTFDLVLMDVQMPEMGGAEATGLIRQRERAQGGHVPIIALTAHALAGDRERCLAAGADGYVAKPIVPEELFREIDSVLRSSEASPVRPSKPASFDEEELLARVGGREDIRREVIDLFLGDGPRLVNVIREHLADGNVAGLCRAAHTLKGSAGNFGARGVVAAAQELENQAGHEDLTASRRLLATLEAEIGKLLTELAASRDKARCAS